MHNNLLRVLCEPEPDRMQMGKTEIKTWGLHDLKWCDMFRYPLYETFSERKHIWSGSLPERPLAQLCVSIYITRLYLSSTRFQVAQPKSKIFSDVLGLIWLSTKFTIKSHRRGTLSVLFVRRHKLALPLLSWLLEGCDWKYCEWHQKRPWTFSDLFTPIKRWSTARH